MSKSYCSLGLMSGTSMDGIDASIIQSDGETKYKAIIDKYFEYPQSIFRDLLEFRDKINNTKDLKKSYPIRWLIVILSCMSTFVMTLLLLYIRETISSSNFA